jgi:hypothetical protein
MASHKQKITFGELRQMGVRETAGLLLRTIIAAAISGDRWFHREREAREAGGSLLPHADA